MEQKYREQSGNMAGLDKVIQVGGSAASFTYDKTANALGAVINLAKKAPDLPQKIAGAFRDGIASAKPGEIKWAEDNIRKHKIKTEKLYFDIGREAAESTGRGGAVETEQVRSLIAEVRKCEQEIQSLNERIAEIDAVRKAEALRRQQLRKNAAAAPKRSKAADARACSGVAEALSQALMRGGFDSVPQQKMFEKIAKDLLDSEVDIKMLAAAALGKFGNENAVPLLIEALGFDSPQLIDEILNSLIMIGDPQAVPHFLEHLPSPDRRVRTGCLRGIYELADDDVAAPVLIEALQDAHPEVRKSVAMFLGSKGCAGAAPALMQSLIDEDAEVRKAVISALAVLKDSSAVPSLIKLLGDQGLDVREKALDALRAISGEDIGFDIHASGPALAQQINDLREWWRQQKPGCGDLEFVKMPGAPEAVREAEEPAKEIAAEEVRVEKSLAEPEPEKQVKYSRADLEAKTKTELMGLVEELSVPDTALWRPKDDIIDRITSKLQGQE